MKDADFYVKLAANALEAASLAMQRQIPDYGDAERNISKAEQAIKYARQINAGTFKGEEW